MSPLHPLELKPDNRPWAEQMAAKGQPCWPQHLSQEPGHHLLILDNVGHIQARF